MKSLLVIAGIAKSGKTMLAKNLQAAFDLERVPVQVSEEIQKLPLASALLVTTPTDEKSLVQTRTLIDELSSKIRRDRIFVVFNEYDVAQKMDPHRIKAQLACNILGAIPQHALVAQAEQEHVTLIASYPQSLPAKYVMKLKDVLLSKHIVEIAQNEILQATGTEGPTYSSIQPRVVKPEVVGKDPQVKLKRKILDQLVEELNLKKLDTETGNDPKKIALLRQRTKQAILAIMQRENIAIADRTAARLFVQDILDEALGLGALEKLLADPAVTEIMVNRKDQIYIEKNGKIQLVPLNFTSDEQLLGIIERIVAPLGRRIDEKTPYCDARLPDGSRVHAIIPPLSLTGPVLTIRKFSKTPFSIQDLIRFGSLTDEIADFLRAATESRQNIVVSGGTGTGKTTLLNVLSSFIPASDRIITVEDSAELRLTQPHVCRLESRPPNIEGKGAITIRDLVRNTLRMRPDRIVVGECRDGAALDMLQAMNTGHDGSLTTVHANNPRDCLSRLETLVMMAGMDLPSRAIREQIASAVNLIVQIARFSDGSRRITHISEVMGIEGDHIQIKDIVVFKQKGIDAQGRVYGDFIKTEHLPHFVMEIEQKGLRLPQGWTVKRRKSDFGEEE